MRGSNLSHRKNAMLLSLADAEHCGVSFLSFPLCRERLRIAAHETRQRREQPGSIDTTDTVPVIGTTKGQKKGHLVDCDERARAAPLRRLPERKVLPARVARDQHWGPRGRNFADIVEEVFVLIRAWGGRERVK